MNKKDQNSVANNSCMEDYIENILAENLTLKRKLESKCEALIILNAELSKLKSERDHLKCGIEDLKKRQPSVSSESDQTTETIRTARDEVELLRQKLRDALGDVQALRNRVSLGKPISDPVDNNSLDREQEFVEQLERLYRAKSQLEADFQVVLDEKEELIKERDAYKCKLHRLNHECNVLMKGNGRGIIDLDALIMENRFLQERLLHSQEECQLAKQLTDKYKSMVQAKKHKGPVKGVNSETGMLLSQKQVKELLEHCGRTEIPGTESNLQELRSLCFALLDSLGDKTLALSHQKRANRILAANFAELQSRLDGLPSQQVGSPSSLLLEGYKFFDGSEISPPMSNDTKPENLPTEGM